MCAVGLLISAQCQTDHVDVVLLHGALQGQAPAAADIKQGHTWPEVKPLQMLIDVGDLRLGQCAVRSGEEAATVLAGGVLEDAEEVIRKVVVGLNVFEMRFH